MSRLTMLFAAAPLLRPKKFLTIAAISLFSFPAFAQQANIAGNTTIGGQAIITNSTNSTSPSTGALQVTGGAGIEGNAYIGGTINGTGSGITVTPSGGSVASTLGALASRIITPMDFGAAGDGVTNDTTAVQNAINAVSAAAAGGTLYLGNHKYCITGITISSQIRIVGTGYSADNGPSPSEFVACEANPPAMITLASGANGSILENFGIYPGTDTQNATSGSAIVNNDGEVVIQNVLIRDACNAIHEIGNSNKYYNLRINATALQNGCIIIDVGSSSVQSIDPQFVGDTIDANDATGATNTVGMLLENVGGAYIAHNDILYMDYGTRILPGAGEVVSGGFFNDTVLGDTTNKDCLDIDPATSTGEVYALQFTSTWCGSTGNTGRGTTAVWQPETGLWISNQNSGLIDGVHFLGARVDDVGGYGFYTSGEVTDLTVDASRFCGANQANTGLPDGEIDSTATDVSIRNSSFGTTCDNTGGGGPLTTPDLNITAGAGIVNLVGNHFFDPSAVVGAAPVNGVIADNYGLDNQEPSIASAATITVPFASTISLTGSTTVTTINGGWPGRIVNIIDTNGAALATGGNIASVPASFGANQLIQCRYSGADWTCR